MTSTQPRPIRVLESVAGGPGALKGQRSVVTASGEVNYPLKPPADWFEDPQLDGPTTLRITDEGRIFGHVASFGVKHLGLPGNVTAPRSKMNYRRFRTGTMVCEDGEEVRVGRLTMDTGHAPMELTADAAARFYDDTGSIIGFVASGDDAHGIWVAGSLRPDIDPADVVVARGSPLSGDWRSVEGNLELVGALAVVVNGFEIPEPLAQVASGQPMSLVAAGMFIPEPDEESAVPDPTSTDTPESLAAASGNPFAKGEPAPPSDEGGDSEAGFDSGDTVSIGDTDMIGQVVTTADDGSVVVELSVPSDMLEHADEDDALAASARFTDRMADRKRDADMARLTKLTASLAETMTSQSAQVDQLLAESRSTRATEALRAAGLDA